MDKIKNFPNKIKCTLKATAAAFFVFFGIQNKIVLARGTKFKFKESDNSKNSLQIVEIENQQKQKTKAWSKGKGIPFKIGVVDREMVDILELENLLKYLRSNLKMLSNIPVPKTLDLDQKQLLLYRSGSNSNENFNFQKTKTLENEKLKEDVNLMGFLLHLSSVAVSLRKKRPLLFALIFIMLISITLISLGYFSPLFFVTQPNFQRKEELKPILNEQEFLSKLDKIKKSAIEKIQKNPRILEKNIEITKQEIQNMEIRKKSLQKKLKKQKLEKKSIEKKIENLKKNK